MKLIKINTDHYIIVDDSEIKEKSGDWFYSFETGKIYDTLIHHTAASCKKITHSTQPLELLSENGLSGMGFSKVRPLNIFEVKELIGEVNVEKKAEEWFKSQGHNIYNHYNTMPSFIDGYNQCLEDNKDKKYTEEDMEAAVCFGMILERFKDDKYKLSDNEEYKGFISSLKPKTEWEVEIIDNKLKLK